MNIDKKLSMWGIFGLTWTVGCVPRTHRLGLIGDQALQKMLTNRLPRSPAKGGIPGEALNLTGSG
jgi:hypothetical protein